LGAEILFQREWQMSQDLKRGVCDRKKLLSEHSLGGNVQKHKHSGDRKYKEQLLPLPHLVVSECSLIFSLTSPL
jgi:hypothetical protein